MLIDTSNYAARDRTFALVRSLDPRPLFAAIYTHGHADHALGLPPFMGTTQKLVPRGDRDSAGGGCGWRSG